MRETKPSDDDDDGGFSVYQEFKSGEMECVRSGVNAEQAIRAAHHYTHSVGARLGITVRVLVVDSEDDIVFEWKRSMGITFPKEARGLGKIE